MKKSSLEVTDETRKCFMAHIKRIGEVLVDMKSMKRKEARKIYDAFKRTIQPDDDLTFQIRTIMRQPSLEQMFVISVEAIAKSTPEQMEQAQETSKVPDDVVLSAVIESRKILKIYEKIKKERSKE